jgi:hypothetical protein
MSFFYTKSLVAEAITISGYNREVSIPIVV